MVDAGEVGVDYGFLESLVPADRVSFAESRRAQYAEDAGPHEPRLPDAVVWPHDTGEVSAVLEAANERGVPVTPWSGGTSLEGNAIPTSGGIVVNTYEMDRVNADPENLQATVGPGIVYDDLNESLAQYGLRFPPGISSGEAATIGGMIANNASGINAVRYGETRDHVRRLEVVLPDGRVIECGRSVIKTSSGYSLKDLFVGSEGTLGIVTEATLALAGLPEYKRAAIASFPDRRAASRTVSDTIGAGVLPGAIEFMDALALEMTNAFSPGLDLPEQPTLIIELHGNNSGIDEDLAFVRTLCEEHGVTRWEEADPDNMDAVWQARRDVYTATKAHREDLDVAVIGDVVVPISRYPDIVEFVASVSDDLGLITPCVGHAGDGNLHFTPVVDMDDPDAVERAHDLNDRVIRKAIDLGGTATGEHGVGVGKRHHMAYEHGGALDVMRAIKDAIDPNGIMNPGKIFPD